MTTSKHAYEGRTVKHSIPITTIRENVPVAALFAFGFGASYGHILELCGEHGPGGWKQYATAGVVDLLCIIGAEERQRDKRIGRARKGIISWPAVVLAIGIAVTLIANIATKEPGALGLFVAVLGPGAMLLAVSILERRSSYAAPARTTEIPIPVPVPVEGSGPELDGPEGTGPEDQDQDRGTDPEPETGERTFEVLLAEARTFRDELAAAGDRLSKRNLRLRLRVGNDKALEVLTALRAEDSEPDEAVV